MFSKVTESWYVTKVLSQKYHRYPEIAMKIRVNLKIKEPGKYSLPLIPSTHQHVGSCNADVLEIKEKSFSILNHINNTHWWEDHSVFKRYHYLTFVKAERREKAWSSENSNNALFTIVTGKSILKGLDYWENFEQRGNIEISRM